MTVVAEGISDSRLRELMYRAVALAGQSVLEPGAPRPRVGAIAVTTSGDVVVEAFRGELPGSHAEYVLIEKAKRERKSLEGCMLFTTLEPCTFRGQGKIPCAERVVNAGFSTVYIGTLDPNPGVTGEGEMYMLMAGVDDVRRFDHDIAAQLRKMNGEFFEAFKKYYTDDPYSSAGVPSSIYTHGDLNAKAAVARVAGDDDRNRLLLQTADLMGAATREVAVVAGDLSWVREVYLPLLHAGLRGIKIRVLAATPNEEVVRAVGSLGAELRSISHSPSIRATLVDPRTTDFAAIVKDTNSSSLLTVPEDGGMLDLLRETFERDWDQASCVVAPHPIEVESVDADWLASRVLETVPQYEGAKVTFETLRVDRTVPLTEVLESAKLFRVRKLELIVGIRSDLAPAGRVVDCPWIIAPPIVEETQDGRLVVVDGTHRFSVAYDGGRSHVEALVVRDVRAPLPASPLTGWDRMRIVRKKIPRSVRYQRFNPALFRDFRKAFETVDRF